MCHYYRVSIEQAKEINAMLWKGLTIDTRIIITRASAVAKYFDLLIMFKLRRFDHIQ